jgi:3-keto-5-aminohexanoate cleavage enzyme
MKQILNERSIMMQKLIITAALSGAEVTPEQQPALPVTPDEIAAAAKACREAGVSIVHVHARDEKGQPTQDINVYRQIKEKIEACTDVIFQPSTGGAVWHTPEERLQPIELKPEMSTLSCGTCNFGSEVFMNTELYMEKFAARMKELGVKPELEIFERGMIENAMKLVKKGLLENPLHFDFVLGVPGACPATMEDLLFMKNAIPAGSTWTVAGIGRHELTMGAAAIMMGGHVRVGFEDNIFYSKGVLAESNAQLAARMVRLAHEFGREVATPDEAREILNIRKR